MRVASRFSSALCSAAVFGQATLFQLPLHLFNRMALWLSPHFDYQGITIVDFRPETRDRFTSLVQEALAFISEKDPNRYRRVLREIKLINHLPTVTGAQYLRPFRVCYIDEQVFQAAKSLHGNVGALACILVHESVHGELFTRHILETSRNRSRIEGVCNREMLRFARRANFNIEGWVEESATPPSYGQQLRFAFRRCLEMLRHDLFGR